MIAYTKQCPACFNKHRWREIQRFARMNKMRLEERRVTRSKELREEAKKYGIEPPFLVEGVVAIPFSGDLKDLLFDKNIEELL